ncbi:MAG: hypothetical protein ABIG39_05860 [Candidatus Micrarchaeota archaeon]
MKKIIIPGIVAGIIMLIVGMAVSMAFSAVFPSIGAEFQNTGLFRPWSDPLMMIFLAYPFVLAFVLAWVWDNVKVLLKEKNSLMKGVKFGLYAWVAFSIPGMFVSYTTFPVSLLMVISWATSGLAYTLCAGIVFSKMNG